MAKFLDTIGLTHLISELDARYAAQFAAADHEHAASDITSGTFAIARIPTGTTSTTVALGNHTHNYLSSVPLATTSAIGGFRLRTAARTSNLSSSITTGLTTSSRYYGVELDSNGFAFVNVPWTDNNTTYTLGSFGITATAAELNKLDGATVTVSEINALDGISTSQTIQQQLNSKQDTLTAGDNISISGNTISSPDVTVSTSGTGTFVTDITSNGHGISLTRGNAPSITIKDEGTGTFVTDVTASGHTITLTRGNGSTYTLPAATSSALGGIKIGYSDSTAKTYPVLLNSSNQAYVSVPWADYSVMTGATSSAAGSSGLVPAPAAGSTRYLSSAGTWTVPADTKNTAGSTNSSSKLFLVGATSQATSATTYSHDTVYVDANGRLNSRQSESGTTVSTVVTAADAMSTADIDAIFESLL